MPASLHDCLIPLVSMSQVVPVTSFPDNEVNVASAGLVQRHSTAFSNERILMQVRGCGVVLGVL